MDIRSKVEALIARLAAAPQYRGQGATLFVDLERRTTRRAFLPVEVLRTFLGGRGANMFLLYNLMQEGKKASDPQIPLIFGVGPFCGAVPASTRGNFTSISPDSRALLDTNAGDFFPTWVKKHGYDHIVLYGKAAEWTLLRIAYDEVGFHDARAYAGLDNLDTCAAIERDFKCRERKDMALARITSAGENLVASAGIMGGIKAIWARGGGGAKMGSMKLKGILVHGKLPQTEPPPELKALTKPFMDKILATSVIKNALRKTGTPFLYKPSRALGALNTKNNQETGWVDSLDADNIDPYRPGTDGCLKCPVRCRPLNDMTPAGKGGWGANAQIGLKGNASYDTSQVGLAHQRERKWQGKDGDGKFDKYDKGDGPEYVTLGKFGPNIGITEPEHTLRLNNILNDLGLDSASAGGAIAWAMELWQRRIIGPNTTGGLDLSWGNFPAVEQLLFMTAKREGFGNVIADGARAVERGHYPAEATKYCMAVKGLFQSDPHDARILKGFALGLAVATRGFDHLRNRPTLEINAHINDNPELKAALYGGYVSPKPDSYDGKELAIRTCENTFAVGDALGHCRFDTKLFNSPSLPGFEDFGPLLAVVTGETFSEDDLKEVGRNITGLERLINWRIGLRAADDTLPERWFEEGNTHGPFKGARIDRAEFARMKQRFYQVTGLSADGIPQPDWHEKLAKVTTGFAVRVELPKPVPGAPDRMVVIDEPVANVVELRAALKRRLPEAAADLDDAHINVAVNGTVLLSGEKAHRLNPGDQVTLVPAMAGG